MAIIRNERYSNSTRQWKILMIFTIAHVDDPYCHVYLYGSIRVQAWAWYCSILGQNQSWYLWKSDALVTLVWTMTRYDQRIVQPYSKHFYACLNNIPQKDRRNHSMNLTWYEYHMNSYIHMVSTCSSILLAKLVSALGQLFGHHWVALPWSTLHQFWSLRSERKFLYPWPSSGALLHVASPRTMAIHGVPRSPEPEMAGPCHCQIRPLRSYLLGQFALWHIILHFNTFQ